MSMTSPIAGLNCDGKVLLAAARLGWILRMTSVGHPLLECSCSGLGAAGAATLPVLGAVLRPPAAGAAFCFESFSISSSCFFIFSCSSSQLRLHGLQLALQLLRGLPAGADRAEENDDDRRQPDTRELAMSSTSIASVPPLSGYTTACRHGRTRPRARREKAVAALRYVRRVGERWCPTALRRTVDDDGNGCRRGDHRHDWQCRRRLWNRRGAYRRRVMGRDADRARV